MTERPKFSLSLVAESIARERIEQIKAFPSHEEHGTPGWVTITEKDRDALVITALAWFDAADAGERSVKRALATAEGNPERRTDFRVHKAVECVECLACGFLFARVHTDHNLNDGAVSAYTCPNCDHWGEIEP